MQRYKHRLNHPLIRTLIACLTIVTLISHAKAMENTMNDTKCPMGEIGTIAAAVEQSCPTVIELESGDTIVYGGQEDNIGKRVRVEYEEDTKFEGMMSFCMQGRRVKITCIEFIEEKHD